jgi:glycerol-3-phosphate acyltransferase PlsY
MIRTIIVVMSVTMTTRPDISASTIELGTLPESSMVRDTMMEVQSESEVLTGSENMWRVLSKRKAILVVVSDGAVIASVTASSFAPQRKDGLEWWN